MLTDLVAVVTLIFSVFALATMLVLPVVTLVSWLTRPDLLRRVSMALHAMFLPVAATAAPAAQGGPFVLPPLTRRTVKSGLEHRLDGLLTRAVEQPRSWWWFGARWLLYVLAAYALFLGPLFGEQMSIQAWVSLVVGFILAGAVLKPELKRKLAAMTMHFGRTFPYVLRPWYWLSVYMRERLAKVRRETARTVFLRRLFNLQWSDGRFTLSHAIANWLTFLLFLFYLPTCMADGIEAGYAWGTYPFGTYRDIVVTQAYRNISDQSTYAVHGYKMIDGVKQEYYFELGPNIWFWQLYVEFQFGQIPVLGRCTFETYGITVRIPQRFRLLKSAGSIYALNPHIVSLSCVAPDIVPK